MNKIYFGIPSYKRADKQITLKMLKDLGISKDRIILSTQTKEDYDEYFERYNKDCNVIFKEGDSVTKNRNNILEAVQEGTWIIMLDDDIKGFYKLDGKDEKKIDSKEELLGMFEEFFKYTEKHKGKMWGVYPVKNAYFMKQSIDKKNIVNSCLGIINYWKFDENYKAKEDIELCCRYIKSGINVIRFNFVTYDVKHKQTGGCSDVWKTDENEKVARNLVMKYPRLLRLNTRRKGEVLYCGKRN